MALGSSAPKKLIAGDKKARFVQTEVAAVAERNVHMLQQRRRVQKDDYTVSPFARWSKNKKFQIKRDGPMLGETGWQ